MRKERRKRPILGFSDLVAHSLFGSWDTEEDRKRRQKAQQERLLAQRVAKKKREEAARLKAEKKQRWHNKYGVDRKKDKR